MEDVGARGAERLLGPERHAAAVRGVDVGRPADAQVAASVREKAAEAAVDAAAAPTMCRMLITCDDGKIDAFIINSKVWGELV